MPYYVHCKNQDATEGDAFLTNADARRAFDPQTQKITFVPSADEFDSWRMRERERFSDGTYIRVPWHYQSAYASHFAHMSVKQPGLIAYTKTEEHGVLDRQTSVRPGRYLEEFYKTIFSAETIANYIAECSAENMILKIARTPDEIETVYTNGPRSCMSKSPDYYESPIHPVRVYGDSDLAVAYYGDIASASARCVVWPDKMIYVDSFYGNGDVLRKLLDCNGWRYGSISGAKIRAVAMDDGRYVMPFLDDATSIGLQRIGGKQWFVIGRGNGEYETSNTDGTTGDTRATCDNCNERYDDDDYGGNGLCQSCYDDAHTSCEDCHDTISNDDARNVTLRRNGTTRRYTVERTVCESCYRDYSDCDGCSETFPDDELTEDMCADCYESSHETCAHPDCSETFRPDDFTAAQTADRKSRNVHTCCDDCATDYSYCDACGEFYNVPSKAVARRSVTLQFAPYGYDVTFHYDGITADDLLIPETSYSGHCSECNRAVVCNQTADLFAVLTTPDPETPDRDTSSDTPVNTFAEPTANVSGDIPVFPLTVYRREMDRDVYWSIRYVPDAWRHFKFPYDARFVFAVPDIGLIDSILSSDNRRYGYLIPDEKWIADTSANIYQTHAEMWGDIRS